jgi:hypothetical protein
MSVRERLRGLPVISEAHPDFDKLATPEMQAAAQRSAKAAGVVEVEPDWERKATPAQREARRKESLRREQKAGETTIVDATGVVIAKYKVEVTFTHRRRHSGLNECGIRIWQSGSKFHGGGDEGVHWCIDTSEVDPRRAQGCRGLIFNEDITGGVAFCRTCQKGIVAAKLSDIYYMNETPAKIALRLNQFFRQLGSNADIYLKFHKSDIRYIAMERAKGPEVARKLKGMAIYPLKNIIKDTSAGADLTNRFKIFLMA